MLLTFLSSEKYGPLTNLVGTVGSIVAAGAAITLAFRGRQKWEPSEEDISRGPQKVAGLLGAVMIVILWALLNDAGHFDLLVRIAVGLAVLCALSLLVYGLLVATQTYYVVLAPRPNETVKRNMGKSLVYFAIRGKWNEQRGYSRRANAGCACDDQFPPEQRSQSV